MKPRHLNRTPHLTGPRTLSRPKQAPQTTWSLRDKLAVAGCVVTALVGASIPFLSQGRAQGDPISRRVEGWRKEFHLGDLEVARLKSIEREYHRAGAPGQASAQAARIHDENIAAAMGGDAGRKFLETRKAGSPH